MRRLKFDSHGKITEHLLNGVQQSFYTVSTASRPRTILGPLQFNQWPIWAKTMRHFSKPEDKGIGDTVARMIGDEKSEAFKKWFEATFKKKCGCNGRQATWNVLYPLKPPSA